MAQTDASRTCGWPAAVSRAHGIAAGWQLKVARIGAEIDRMREERLLPDAATLDRIIRHEAYKARFYSTFTGQFVSADPTAPSTSSTPLNRFTYGNNNPVRFVDPSGYASQEDIDNCAAHVVECFEFAFGGKATLGFIIVMGLHQTLDNLEEWWWGYGREILSRYRGGCGGAAVEGCWAGLQALMNAKGGGADAVYRVFGIKFIESDKGGHFWRGLLDTVFGSAYRELDRTIKGSEIPIFGIIGSSKGAAVVAHWYANNHGYGIAFFLDEPAIFDREWNQNKDRATDRRITPEYAGRFDWGHCGCGSAGGHGVNNRSAAHVLDVIESRYADIPDYWP